MATTIDLTDTTKDFSFDRYQYYVQGTAGSTIQLSVVSNDAWDMYSGNPSNYSFLSNCTISPTSGTAGTTPVTVTLNQDAFDYAIYISILGSPRDALISGSIIQPDLTSSTQGVEVYNSSGVKILDTTSRLIRFVADGSISAIPASSTSSNITISGMEDSSTWVVLTEITDPIDSGLNIEINKYNGYFNIVNPYSSSTLSLNYWVVRSS